MSEATLKANRSAFGWSWSWGPIAIILAALCIYTFAHLLQSQQQTRQAQQQVDEAQQQLQTAVHENQNLHAATALMAAPGTQSVAVRAEPPAAQGRIFLNPDGGAVLLATALPPPSAGRRYEMWLLPATGSPIAAGMFAPTASGEAVQSYRHKLTGVTGIAVSLEPEAGSKQPTGPIVLAAKLPAGQAE